MLVHLVRHGRTATSGHTYAGRSDVPLCDAGRAEAEALAAALGRRPVAAILSSPLLRALDTARPLAGRLGLPVETEPALAEFDFGAHEGQPKELLGLRLRRDHLVRPVPGGESLLDLWHRAGLVAESLGRLGPGIECVVVGHFWINRLLYGRLAGLGFEAACADRRYRPATGSSVLVAPVPRPDAGG